MNVCVLLATCRVKPQHFAIMQTLRRDGWGKQYPKLERSGAIITERPFCMPCVETGDCDLKGNRVVSHFTTVSFKFPFQILPIWGEKASFIFSTSTTKATIITPSPQQAQARSYGIAGLNPGIRQWRTSFLWRKEMHSWYEGSYAMDLSVLINDAFPFYFWMRCWLHANAQPPHRQRKITDGSSGALSFHALYSNSFIKCLSFRADWWVLVWTWPKRSAFFPLFKWMLDQKMRLARHQQQGQLYLIYDLITFPYLKLFNR